MDFVAVVDQVIALLRQRGRVAYRTLQRQFQLDDDALHDLTEELLAQVARATPGYFAPVADAPGFAEALYRLVRELRGAGYDLADLEPLLAGTTDAPEKSSALAELLAAFEARRAHFYGPDDALAVADPSRLDGLALLVYGVLEMPHALERLVLGIAERQPVDVYLPEVAGAVQAPVAALRARLTAAGAADRRSGQRRSVPPP